jgi:hypothetical protein
MFSVFLAGCVFNLVRIFVFSPTDIHKLGLTYDDLWLLEPPRKRKKLLKAQLNMQNSSL